MLRNRVIPCLLIDRGGLIKTRRFKDPKYVGDPINAIKIFNEKEVDELIVLDICATTRKREPDYSLIEQFASECFMPVCYGGGIRSVEQTQRIFALGVEKVSVQTKALEDLNFISSLADRFGSQSIVASIDIKRNFLGRPKVFKSSTRKAIGLAWKALLRDIVNAGAGELLINSVDCDGMMQGMDIDLVKEASGVCNIPLIVSGGVGSMAHIRDAIDAGADAVAAGSFFVFQGVHRAVLITYPDYSELEILLGKRNELSNM